ncbi:MAG: GTPase, partial [Nanoarchaeota archaeon]
APKHKSSENLIAQLRARLKKFQGEIEKTKKLSRSRGGKTGIKKLEMQAAIIGLTNSGKSSLLSLLTKAHPKISETNLTTTHSTLGMMPYQGTQIQLIEIPAIDSELYDKGTVYTADSILILIQNIEELKRIEPLLQTKGKKIIALNKSDLLSELEKRRLEATLKSKYKNYEFVFISCITHEGIEELKEKIFKSFNKIRVYTKEPGKQKSDNPLILEPETTIKEVAEKILKGFSEKVKETKIWGPSSKFSGQKVGLQHKLKDLDVVEFKTR